MKVVAKARPPPPETISGEDKPLRIQGINYWEVVRVEIDHSGFETNWSS